MSATGGAASEHQGASEHGGGGAPGPEERARGEESEGAARATPEEQEREFDVSRLRLGDLISVVAAFALLFIMAGDWYSTATGEEAREIVNLQGTERPGTGLIDEGAAEDARVEAEQAERNAWEVSSPLDLLVLLGLLATFAAALTAAALRAAGREYPDPRRSPGAVAAFIALAALLLVLLQAGFRLDPDSDVTTEVGLPLGVAALGAIAFGAAYALRDQGPGLGRRPDGQSGPAPGGEARAGASGDPGAGEGPSGPAYNRAR